MHPPASPRGLRDRLINCKLGTGSRTDWTGYRGPAKRIRLATEAVGIVDQYADGDIRAAMILGRAHAEAGYAPRVSMISVVQLLVQANEFAEFVDNFRDRVTEFDSLALRVGDKATAQLVTDVTNPEALFGYALVLIRHFIRSDRSEATLNFLKAAMLCLDGARVMTSGRAMTPVVNFLIGLSAIMACRITGLADPLGCSKMFGFDYRNDEAMGKARLQSAKDLSVGSFRSLIGRYAADPSMIDPAFDEGVAY